VAKLTGIILRITHRCGMIFYTHAGMTVGYLSREDAEVYRLGLLALQAREGKSIGLRGVIVRRPCAVRCVRA
jgi:hypothetical protein